MSLAASRQPPGDVVLDHAQRLPGGMAVVVGPESPERATQLLRSAGHRIAGLLSGAVPRRPRGRLGTPGPVGAGNGTCRGGTAGAGGRASTRRGTRRRRRARGLPSARAPALVLVGSGPYSARRRDQSARVPGDRHRRRRPRGAPGPWRRAARSAPLLGPLSSVRSAHWLPASPCLNRSPGPGGTSRPRRNAAMTRHRPPATVVRRIRRQTGCRWGWWVGSTPPLARR